MKKLLAVSLIALSVSLAKAQENKDIYKTDLPYYDWKMKDGKYKEVFEQNCLMCHSPGYVFGQAKGKSGKDMWRTVVYQMINEFKAPISKENAEKIIEYLNENYTNRN
jgi:cytochrome c1